MESKVATYNFIFGPFDHVHYNSNACRSGADIPILQSFVLLPGIKKMKFNLFFLVTNEMKMMGDMDAFKTLIVKYLRIHGLDQIEPIIITSLQDIENPPQYYIQIQPTIFMNKQDFFLILDDINTHYNTDFTGQVYIPRFTGTMAETSWFTFWLLTLQYWFMQWQGWLGVRRWAWIFLAFYNGPIIPTPTFVPNIYVQRNFKQTHMGGFETVKRNTYTDKQPKLLEKSYFNTTPETWISIKPDNYDPNDKDPRYHATSRSWYRIPQAPTLVEIAPTYHHFLGTILFFNFLIGLGYVLVAMQPFLRKISLHYLGMRLDIIIGSLVYVGILAYIYYRWNKVTYHGPLIGEYNRSSSSSDVAEGNQHQLLPGQLAPIIVQKSSKWKAPQVKDILWWIVGASKWITYPLSLIHFISYYTLACVLSVMYSL